MTASRARTALAAATLAAAAMVVAGCGSDWEVDPATESVLSSTIVTSVEPATATSTVPVSSVTDTSDLGNLMAVSTHVFTGYVATVAGTTALGPIPETQFSVYTTTSLKGLVPETVKVDQQGGVVDGIYTSVNGDTPLTVGKWYLFATRHLESEGWYTVIPVHGHIPVTEQQARDITSPVLAAAARAIRANPHNQLTTTPAPSPSLTFPTPTPGDHHPIPPSPPQQPR